MNNCGSVVLDLGPKHQVRYSELKQERIICNNNYFDKFYTYLHSMTQRAS